jgi:histone-lysine N-methyltransferase SETD3
MGQLVPLHRGDYLTFTASTVNTDRLYQAKKQILEGMGMSADEQAFPVFADRMPLQLLAYMRFARWGCVQVVAFSLPNSVYP